MSLESHKPKHWIGIVEGRVLLDNLALIARVVARGQRMLDVASKALSTADVNEGATSAPPLATSIVVNARASA
jgi:hypothetical protein